MHLVGKIIRQSRFSRVMPALIIIGIALFAASILLASVSAQTENPYPVRTFLDSEGRLIDEVVFSGRPPEVKAAVVSVPEPHIAAGINLLANVPAFDWSYGCAATAAAMLFGYYDNGNYVDMYTGPENDGVVPMDNSTWGSGECPLSATHQGYDGLRRHRTGNHECGKIRNPLAVPRLEKGTQAFRLEASLYARGRSEGNNSMVPGFP